MARHRPGLLARLFALLRGGASRWLRGREEESPHAVYENAIQQRLEQYQELKDAVAGILYTRNKLEGELGEHRRELARTQEDLQRAVRGGDDDAGLALIQHKHRLEGEVERGEREAEGLRQEADQAKASLVRFRDEIRSLERERGRAVVALAGARARERLNSALEGLSVDADVRALENVRERVGRVGAEGALERELAEEGGLADRVREIRREADAEAARRELDAMKRALRPKAELGARAERAAITLPS